MKKAGGIGNAGRDGSKGADLIERTRDYALRIIRLYAQLPKTTTAQVMGKQLLRSGTSVGAQFRESRRSRSDAEFVSKLQSALQELEETAYWLELLQKSGAAEAPPIKELAAETDELTAVLVTCVKRVKRRKASASGPG